MINIFQEVLFNKNFDQLNNMVRWNGMNRIKDESVAHHSFIVSWFTRILAEEIFQEDCYKIKLDLITYATFHDFDEMFTGDINHNVKYNKHNGVDIRKEVDNYVNFVVEKYFNKGTKTDKLFKDNLLMEDKSIKKIVKVADWLSMCFYVKKEIELGNRIIQDTYRYCIKSLNEAADDCDTYLFSRISKDIMSLQILRDIQKIDWKYYE